MKIKELSNKKQIKDFFNKYWGGDFIITQNRKYYAKNVDAFAVFEEEEIIGLVTYHIDNGECGIISLNSFQPNKGIGATLIERVKEKAKLSNCQRIWLGTTNDNIDALKFYRKRGFVLKKILPNIIEEYRKIKPSIPELGSYGIPMRDELELEYKLSK